MKISLNGHLLTATQRKTLNDSASSQIVSIAFLTQSSVQQAPAA
jgi:hypothetical protein